MIKENTKANIKPGYKKTPVGIIPEDWEVSKLEQVATIQNGRGYSHLNDGEIPVYASGGIINYVDDYLNEGESVGIGRKGTIDKPQLLKGKYWVVDTLFYINEFKNVLPYFLYSQFAQVNWYKYNESSGLPSLIKNTIKKIPLAIPPLPEQKAIADCLSTWDKGIEKLSALIASKKEQKKGLMQGLFSGELKVENGELVKVEDEKLWLKEWKEVRLEQVAKVVMGVSPSSKNYNDEKEGMLLIQGNADIKNRVSSPRQYTSEITKECNIGDILMSVRAPVGEISKSIHNACIGRGICAIQSNKNAESNFLYYYLVYTESLWSRLKQGSTFESVNTTDIKDFKLTIPTITEQTTISNVLTIADKEIEILEKKLETFKTQKKGLMQVLLTGEKRLV